MSTSARDKTVLPGTSISRPLWAPLCLILFFTACAASKVDYTLIDQGIDSGKRGPSLQFEVITDPERFKRLLTEVYPDRTGAKPPPEIDFQASLVLFIGMGEKPSAGYRVTVEEVTRSKERLRVKIGLQEPRPDSFQATVMTHPFTLVEVKKSPGLKEVEWVDREGKRLGQSEMTE